MNSSLKRSTIDISRQQPGVAAKMRPNHWYLHSIHHSGLRNHYKSPKMPCLTGTRISTKIHLSSQTNSINPWYVMIHVYINHIPKSKLFSHFGRITSQILNHHNLGFGGLGSSRVFISTLNVAAREWLEADRRPGCLFFGHPLLNEKTQREALEIEKLSGYL